MSKNGVDVLIIAPGPNFNWLFDFTPLPDERACFACITSTDLAFLVPALNFEQLRAEIDCPFYVWDDQDGPCEKFKNLVSGLSQKRFEKVAVEECLRADFFSLVNMEFYNASIVFSKSIVGKLRMVKSNSEIEKLRESARIADCVMKQALETFSSNMTELELSSLVNLGFHQQGAKPAFSLVSSGVNGAFPHHHSDNTQIQKGVPTIIDIGASVNGYFSDMTRMAHIHKPSEKCRLLIRIVEEALSRAIESVIVGQTISNIDKAARDVIIEAGFGKFFNHRTGHGVGLEIHEPPFITNTNNLILEEGMVFTIEPGIYLPGEFGVRLEEVVHVTRHGAEVLSNLCRDLFVVS